MALFVWCVVWCLPASPAARGFYGVPNALVSMRPHPLAIVKDMVCANVSVLCGTEHPVWEAVALHSFLRKTLLLKPHPPVVSKQRSLKSHPASAHMRVLLHALANSYSCAALPEVWVPA